MKKEDLYHALNDLDEKDIKEAGEYTAEKKTSGFRKWGTVLVGAAVCVCALTAGPKLLKPQNNTAGGGNDTAKIVTVSAVYPEKTAEGQDPEQFLNSNAHWDWWQEYLDVVRKSEEIPGQICGYTSDIMKELLVSDSENTVCSPLNTYIALAMLAEVTDGNSRAQILKALQAADIETLRTRVNALWQSNYVQTPALCSVLGNSLWLSDEHMYHTDTVQRLADIYYASTYSGTMGSETMDEALRKWTDFQTGGLLSEYVKNMSLDPRSVLEMVSTICFKAQWVGVFHAEYNTREIFHGAKGDTEAEMMHKVSPMPAWDNDRFTAVGLWLNDSGMMYFLLPKEGTDVNDLLKDGTALSILDRKEEDGWNPEVVLTVPKFRVSAQKDLKDVLSDMGITDIMDCEKADFSPLSDETGIFLNTAYHTAMAEIDENGVTGAAYTELALAGEGIPEERIEFVLDRPFAFLVTGKDGSVLFAGAVRNIGE